MDEIDRVETSELIVPYRDIATTGEMQTAAYVTHAEAALQHFFRYRPPLEDEPVYAVSKLELRLITPLREGDVVQLRVRVDKIGGKSIGFEVEMDRDGETAASLEVTWTTRSRETGEPVALPEDIRDWLYRYLP
ncbi:acyl-CoA thioesterase [Rhizobium sp. G187]|uniref:acyl-CoA thioesterase n=1 Tax=Rhizobium sp. G187 TaxID=3451352 RepID=UPI003EE44BFD